ncbi:MAG: transketolase [Eubacteriales bacterium]|nr:transketolase [Eubacteriales bacterium]
MKYTAEALADKAREARRICMQMSYIAGSEGAHIGPALSIMDITTVLYFDVMNYKVDDRYWSERDRFILSKGHACLGQYAPLVLCGFISEEESKTFNRTHTRLAGHPSGIGVPGIEHPSGSLGHGLAVGCGIALAGKMDRKDYNTYVLIGDGEANEGSIWESVMFAKQHKLDNLVAIVDVNNLQYGGKTADLMDMSPMKEKWEAFGWNVITTNGNDVAELQIALDKSNKKRDVPTCVIANTVKGFGLSFIANNNDWHHCKVTKEILERALDELK